MFVDYAAVTMRMTSYAKLKQNIQTKFIYIVYRDDTNRLNLFLWQSENCERILKKKHFFVIKLFK